MHITAAVQRSIDGPPTLEPLDLDAPRDDDVLVRIVACGICHTDLMAPRFLPLPLVLGHEGAGIVAAVGPRVRKVRPGDRVVLSFPSCGTCARCLGAEPAYCANTQSLWYSGRRADGSPTLSNADGPVHGAFFQQSSFATHALAIERNVVKVPDDVPLELLGSLGCGVQTGAGAVINTFQLGTGSTLAVFGAGGVGLSAIMAAKIAGADTIIAADTNPARLELALQVGATHTVDARDGDVAARIVALTGEGVQFSLETSATVPGFQGALDCLAKRGTAGMVAVPQLGAPFTFTARPILAGRRIVGIIEGDAVPDLFIPRLVDWYRAGRLPLEAISEYFDFARIGDALAAGASGRVVKPILRMA
jgi:aryl-alcohol dehydrogenase